MSPCCLTEPFPLGVAVPMATLRKGKSFSKQAEARSTRLFFFVPPRGGGSPPFESSSPWGGLLRKRWRAPHHRRSSGSGICRPGGGARGLMMTHSHAFTVEGVFASSELRCLARVTSFSFLSAYVWGCSVCVSIRRVRAPHYCWI